MKQSVQTRINTAMSFNARLTGIMSMQPRKSMRLVPYPAPDNGRFVYSFRLDPSQHGSETGPEQLGVLQSCQFLQSFEDLTVGLSEADGRFPGLSQIPVSYATLVRSLRYGNELYGLGRAHSGVSSQFPHRRLSILAVSFPQFQQGEAHALWPLSSSSSHPNHKTNLPHYRTLGVRTQTRCLYRSRPVNSQVSNLRSLREGRFPARKEASGNCSNSLLAKSSLVNLCGLLASGPDKAHLAGFEKAELPYSSGLRRFQVPRDGRGLGSNAPILVPVGIQSGPHTSSLEAL